MKVRLMHNAHMLIPQPLWNRAVRRAKLEGKTITQIFCEGVNLKLKTKKNGQNGKR